MHIIESITTRRTHTKLQSSVTVRLLMTTTSCKRSGSWKEDECFFAVVFTAALKCIAIQHVLHRYVVAKVYKVLS